MFSDETKGEPCDRAAATAATLVSLGWSVEAAEFYVDETEADCCEVAREARYEAVAQWVERWSRSNDG